MLGIELARVLYAGWVIKLNRKGLNKIIMLSAIRGIPKSNAHGVKMKAVSMATAIVITLPATLFRLKENCPYCNKLNDNT